MSELRDKVVEAMAQAMCRHPFADTRVHRDDAAAALDAALDVLGERDEEWILSGQIGHGAWGVTSPQIIRGLLAVLRS